MNDVSLLTRLKLSVKNFSGYILILISLLLCDQATKYLAEKNFMLNSSSSNIHSYLSSSQPVFNIGSATTWLNFSTTYVRNTGAAWGFLGDLPENIRPWFFYILTSIVMVIILIFFLKTHSEQILIRLGIAFVLSGALGNFVDRVNLNYVIDWLHFEWKIFGWAYDYPVFNVADSAIVSGVILLIADAIIDEIRKKKESQHGTTVP